MVSYNVDFQRHALLLNDEAVKNFIGPHSKPVSNPFYSNVSSVYDCVIFMA